VKKVRFKRIFLIYMSGNFINYIVPIRVGEFAKSFLLKKTDRLQVSKSLPSVFLDKVMDLFLIVVVVLLVPLLAIRLNNALWILILLIFLVFAALILVLFLSIKYEDAIIKILRKLFFWIPEKYEEITFRFVDNFVKNTAIVIKKPSIIAPIALLSLLAAISDAIYFGSFFRAFGYDINWLFVLFGYTLLNLSFVLPTAPVQIGNLELVLLLIFQGIFGIDANLVGAVSIFAHLVTGTIIIIIGLISLGILGIGLSQVFKIDKN